MRVPGGVGWHAGSTVSTSQPLRLTIDPLAELRMTSEGKVWLEGPVGPGPAAPASSSET